MVSTTRVRTMSMSQQPHDAPSAYSTGWPDRHDVAGRCRPGPHARAPGRAAPGPRRAADSGRALTVDAHDDLMPMLAGLRLAGPGDVLVVVGHEQHAVAGELFATEALRRGVTGIVIDGRCRDSRTLARLNLPVYARGVAPTACPARAVPVIQVPVLIGGVEVRPGDLVLGDDDGIVVVSDDEVLALLEGAEVIQRREEALQIAIAAGTTLFDSLNYDEHLAALEAGRGQPARLLVTAKPTVAYARRMDRVRPSAIRELLRLGCDPQVISFGVRLPRPALFPVDELHEVYAECSPPSARSLAVERFAPRPRSPGATAGSSWPTRTAASSRTRRTALRYGPHLVEELDTEGRVLHLGSFSKILAPGMRLGWALVPPEIQRSAQPRDTQNSTLNMTATSD